MLNKIVVLDADSLGAGIDLTQLSPLATHVEIHSETVKEHVAVRIVDADVVITNKVPIDSACIKQAACLKLICVAATGVNNVDISAAARANVIVSNVVNYGADTVAQHTFSLILALTNQVKEYHADVIAGVWSQQSNFCLMSYPITELAGKTLLLCGFGAIGRAVGRIAEAFGMKVMVAARSGQPTKHIVDGFERVALEIGLRQADIVSIHCPLNEMTHHLISSDEFTLMKRSALIINTARGGIVDEQALYEALSSGEIAGAGLDVFAEEPPQPDHPLISANFPNLLLTPHCAWTALEARQRLFAQVVSNIANYIAKKPSNIVQ